MLACKVPIKRCNTTTGLPTTLDKLWGSLEEVLLLVGDDGDVAGGVGHAGQHKAVVHLGVVQEGLVALVNGTGLDLAGAAGAGTCWTTHR